MKLDEYGVTTQYIESQEYFKTAQKINKKFRPAEAYIIREYTGSEYLGLNKYLRGKRDPRDEKYENFTTVAARGLDKIPKHKGIVFRGSRLLAEDFKVYSDALKKKSGSVVEKGFLSTTTDINRKFDGNTFYQITSKRGRSVKLLSEFSTEEEVLFKAGSKFRVIRAVENTYGYEIELEEI